MTALFVGSGIAYMAVTPKVWKATARVLLDPRDKQVSGPSLSQPLQGVDTVWIDTQSDLVTSANNLDTVIDRLNLAKSPDFGSDREAARRKLATLVHVDRADQTYVLDVSAFTTSPQQSADIAQTLAEAYVASTIRTKAEQVRQASGLIQRQLDELRAAARAAQEKLETYRREHGLITANGRSVEEDTLRQLNDAYVAAQVKARDAKARSDQIAAALKGGGRDASIDGIDSSVLSRLKIDAAQAARNLDDLSHQLGPSHPRMIAARASLDRARAEIAAELRSLAAAAANDYAAARAAEAAAAAAVDKASAAVTTSSEKSILLKELEDEAALRADMYKTYLARTAEIGLQADTQVSDASVVVPASPPLRPYSPRGMVVLGIAGIAGLGFAFSFALYRGRRYLVECDGPDADEADADRDEDDEPGRVALPDVSAPESEPAGSLRPVAVDADVSSDPQLTDDAEQAGPAEPIDAAPVLSAPASGPVVGSPSDHVEPPAVLVSRDHAEPRKQVEPSKQVGTPAVDATPRRAVIVGELEALADVSAAGRRDPRANLTSIHADGEGRLRPGIDERMAAILGRIVAEGGDTGAIMVVGLEKGPMAAAVALALARIEPEKGGVLLVDAADDEAPLALAYVDEVPPGIVEVITDGIDGSEIAVCPDDSDLTLIGTSLPERRDDVAIGAGAISAFIGALACDYGRLIVNLGHRHPPELMEAMLARVGTVLIVGDRAMIDDDEARDVVDELAAAMPVFCGLVVIGDRAGASGSASEEEAA